MHRSAGGTAEAEVVDLPALGQRPLVSIIVPSYNQGRFIGETLESILSQSYRPLEIVVIDGASTDETLDVIRSFDGNSELRWWSEPDSGVVEAVNKGFSRARGEIGAIQSSDDCYMPGAVGRGVKALTEDPAVGFVFGDVVKIDAGGRELLRTSLGPFSMENMLSHQIWIPQPSTFFRLDLARSLGGWREEVAYAADTDLWLRMAFRAKARKLDALMAKRRVHDKQRNNQGARIIRDYSRAIESLDDLRQAPRRLQRAAAAGVLLVANHYASGDSYGKKLWRRWRALMLFPGIWKQTGLGAYLPGWYRVHRCASAIKRMILGPGQRRDG